MEDTFTLDDMMVPSTDTQGAFTLDEMNMPEPDFNKPQQLGYFESIAESFMRGERSWQTDKLGYEALQKGKSFYEANVRPAEDKLYDDMAKKRLASGGMIASAGLSLAEMAPGLIHGAAGGVVGGSLAGLGAAAVGSVLPIPEEVVTVPAAFGAGFTVGSAKEWYEQGAGNLYNSMARDGVPDEIAQPTAHIAGALYSAIEFAQFHKYIPGGKEASKKLIASTVQNTIKNVVKKYGTNWAENVFEEGLQEIVNESAKEYAKAVSGKSDTATGDKVLSVMTKGWQAMKSSALPMLLLLAPAMGKASLDIAAEGKPKTATVEPTPTPTQPEIVEPGANVGDVVPTESIQELPQFGVKEPTDAERFLAENPEGTADEYVASKTSSQSLDSVQSFLEDDANFMKSGYGVDEVRVKEIPSEHGGKQVGYTEIEVVLSDRGLGENDFSKISRVADNIKSKFGFEVKKDIDEGMLIIKVPTGIDASTKSQLTADFYAAKGKMKTEPTAADIIEAEGDIARPPEPPVQVTIQEPQPEGEHRVAKAARDVSRRHAERGFEGIPESEKATYSGTTKEAQIEAVTEMIANDYQTAIDIATNKTPAPSGISSHVVFNAVEQKAISENDSETIAKLVSSGVASRRSQIASELSTAGFNAMEEGSVVEAVTAIKKSREDAKKPDEEELSDLQKRLQDAESKLKALESKEKPKLQKKSVSPKSKEFGANNKIVTKQMADEAIKKFFSIGKTRGSAFGADILAEKIFEAGKIGTFYIEGGVRDFADWSKTMVEVLGDEIIPHLKSIWDNSKKSYQKAEYEDIISEIKSSMEEGKDIEEIASKINSLALNLVEGGVTDRDKLVDDVLKSIEEIYPDATRRQVSDIISGYGKFSELDKDEAKVKLRELRGQLQQVSKLEDIRSGKAPLKTGRERREISKEESDLIKQVNQAKKEHNIVTTDPAKQLKSALETTKTRLKNQIYELEKQIKSGKKVVKGKSVQILDKEASELKSRRDKLKQQLENIVNPPKTPAEKANILMRNSLERQILELEEQIKSGKKIVRGKPVIILEKETAEMKANRDALRKKLNDIINPPKTDAEKADIAIQKRLNKQIDELNKQISSGKKTVKGKTVQILTKEASELKKKRDELRQRLEEIVNPRKSAEEKEIDTLKKRISTQIKDIEERIQKGDFSARQKKAPSTNPDVIRLQKEVEQLRSTFKAAREIADGITQEEIETITRLSNELKTAREAVDEKSPDGSDDRMTEGYALVQFRKYINQKIAERENLPVLEYFKPGNRWKGIKNILGFTKAITTTLDNSVIGRQGLPTLINHTDIWFKNSVQSFIDLWNVLGDKEVMDFVLADVLSRKNADLYKKEKLDIGVTEESIPTTIHERIPALGRLFKASNIAFKAWQYRTRADLFDKIYEMAQKNDSKVEGLGIMVNAMTGRGKLPGELERFSETLNIAFFSPRFIKSQFDILTAHAADRKNMSDFVKKQALFNTLRTVAVLATVLAIFKAFDDDSVEEDPRSSDFGQVKIGKTRFNISGGVQAIAILAARIIMNSTKDAHTDIITELNTGEYGSSTVGDVIMKFFDGKLSPAGKIVSTFLLKGRDAEGKKPSVVGEMAKLVTPIPLTNAYELMTEEDAAPVLLGLMADFVGIGTNTYSPDIRWENRTGKEMIQFRDYVGEETFKEANKEFNQEFNSWMNDTRDTVEYSEMDDDDKRSFLQSKREKLKNEVFRKYGFKYKKSKDKSK